jgi:O-antigen chain-terminating methyltransferase
VNELRIPNSRNLPVGIIGHIPFVRNYIHTQILFFLKPVIKEVSELLDDLSKDIAELRPRELKLNYLAMENAEGFRNSMDVIRERNSSRYLSFFDGRKNVLDIGCGRGEFLEVLRDSGIHAAGVDANKEMMKLCISKGLNVVHDDAIKYLENVKDKSLDGIIMTQVIEHVESAYAFDLLKLCYKKMTDNAVMIVETINIGTLCTVQTFFKDPTHIRPLHPDTLKFMLEQAGFKDLQIRFYAEPVGLKLLSTQTEDSRIINENMERLNKIIFGCQDYAVIGRRL